MAEKKKITGVEIPGAIHKGSAVATYADRVPKPEKAPAPVNQSKPKK